MKKVWYFNPSKGFYEIGDIISWGTKSTQGGFETTYKIDVNGSIKDVPVSQTRPY